MMASAHVCYGNYLPAMGITFILHTHGDVCYGNYFLKKKFPILIFFEKILSLNLKKNEFCLILYLLIA